jgi:hypothetical protein
MKPLYDPQKSPPYCVQVELTEGCNLRCSFCGINGIRGKDRTYNYMSVVTAYGVATQLAQLGWSPRIEFSMHGEPTMNESAKLIVKIFREQLPKAYLLMNSNGAKLTLHEIREFFNAGLDTLALDEYEGITLVPRLRTAVRKAVGAAKAVTLGNPLRPGEEYTVHLHEYPADGPVANPHQRSKHKRLVFVSPISTNSTGVRATLNNHAGCGAPPNSSAVDKRCAKPFRELSIRWDGQVAICCNDWRGEYVVGYISGERVDHDHSVLSVWTGERMQAARKLLLTGRRAQLHPCNVCDAVSYRPGLLPDARGKQTMAPFDEYDGDVVQQAMKEAPLATVNERPWEQQLVSLRVKR